MKDLLRIISNIEEQVADLRLRVEQLPAPDPRPVPPVRPAPSPDKPGRQAMLASDGSVHSVNFSSEVAGSQYRVEVARLMPLPNVIDITPIEMWLDKLQAAGKVGCIGVMAVEDPGKVTTPAWVQSPEFDAIETAPGRWVPDYCNPHWLKAVRFLARKILERYGDDPRVASFEIGPFGHYNEQRPETTKMWIEDEDGVTRRLIDIYNRKWSERRYEWPDHQVSRDARYHWTQYIAEVILAWSQVLTGKPCYVMINGQARSAHERNDPVRGGLNYIDLAGSLGFGLKTTGLRDAPESWHGPEIEGGKNYHNWENAIMAWKDKVPIAAESFGSIQHHRGELLQGALQTASRWNCREVHLFRQNLEEPHALEYIRDWLNAA